MIILKLTPRQLFSIYKKVSNNKSQVLRSFLNGEHLYTPIKEATTKMKEFEKFKKEYAEFNKEFEKEQLEKGKVPKGTKPPKKEVGFKPDPNIQVMHYKD